MNNYTHAKYLVTMASFSSKNFSSGKFRKSSIDLNEIQERKKKWLAARKKHLHSWQSGNWSIVKILKMTKLINRELYSQFSGGFYGLTFWKVRFVSATSSNTPIPFTSERCQKDSNCLKPPLFLNFALLIDSACHFRVLCMNLKF